MVYGIRFVLKSFAYLTLSKGNSGIDIGQGGGLLMSSFTRSHFLSWTFEIDVLDADTLAHFM